MKYTVKVPLADIRAFKKNSAFIKNNSILPIYGFIKFDNGTITKNSKYEFVTQESNFSGAFLVEEQVLFNYIEYATSSDIIFTIDKQTVTMTDGETKQTCTTDDIKLYPVCEEPPKEQYNFDEVILKAIGAAASYTRDDEHDLIISHIYIGNNSITASDRLIGYCKEVEVAGDLPKTAIHKAVAEKIAKMPAGQFSETPSKCFYKVGAMLYGFSKTEATYVDLRKYFSLPKGEKFIINKTKMADFNDLCLANSPLKYAWPTFSIQDYKMLLSVTDSTYGRAGEKLIDVDGRMTGQFQYDAALMNKVLKSCPDEELTFYQSNSLYYITGNAGFSALIMELKTNKP